MGTIIVVINYIIVILSYVEYFSRNSTYIDFGYMGLTLFYLECIIIILFLLSKKTLQDIIAFIISIVLVLIYYKMAAWNLQ